MFDRNCETRQCWELPRWQLCFPAPRAILASIKAGKLDGSVLSTTAHLFSAQLYQFTTGSQFSDDNWKFLVRIWCDTAQSWILMPPEFGALGRRMALGVGTASGTRRSEQPAKASVKDSSRSPCKCYMNVWWEWMDGDQCLTAAATSSRWCLPVSRQWCMGDLRRTGVTLFRVVAPLAAGLQQAAQ